MRVDIGRFFRKPAPRPSAEEQFMQSLLLDKPKPAPWFIRILRRFWRWC